MLFATEAAPSLHSTIDPIFDPNRTVSHSARTQDANRTYIRVF